MSRSEFDVLCLGNAIVDVIARVDDSFVSRHNLVKGSMNLIDEARAELLYSDMGQAIEVSGGSAGNTAAGVASFGGKTAYFGKVKSDQLGAIFRHDMRAQPPPDLSFSSLPTASAP
jgi:sugar/nucleoside kinase (ribokinase family)